MNAIKATVKDRQVLIEVPADWPEGCEVVVKPVTTLEREEDDEDSSTPDVIAVRLALMDQLEPGWLSPGDAVAWREQKEYEKANFFEDAEIPWKIRE